MVETPDGELEDHTDRHDPNPEDLVGDYLEEVPDPDLKPGGDDSDRTGEQPGPAAG